MIKIMHVRVAARLCKYNKWINETTNTWLKTRFGV